MGARPWDSQTFGCLTPTKGIPIPLKAVGVWHLNVFEDLSEREWQIFTECAGVWFAHSVWYNYITCKAIFYWSSFGGAASRAMILYQHDKVHCPCSCTSLSKADCDGLKLLYADSTMSALHGVCSLKHSNSPKQKIQFFGSAERSQSNLEEQVDLREGRYQGDGTHCRTWDEEWLSVPLSPTPTPQQHWALAALLHPAQEAPPRDAMGTSSQPPRLSMS